MVDKKWLQEQNIEVEGYKVYHTSKKCGRRELKPVLNIKHHKYGKDVKYYIVGFYSRQDHRQYTFPLQRILYAWHRGPIMDGEDVDHINNISLDNNIENLQTISHIENMRKRPGNGNNQHNCEYNDEARYYKLFYEQFK